MTRAIYIDGETKTGKGAAGQAIAEALKAAGYKVYYDVAGDFYRRFVALVRQELRLAENAPLPEGPGLEAVAAEVYASRTPYNKDIDLGDLQRSAISESVAVLSQLALVQQAGNDWWLESARAAVAIDADVVVLDGRNPRSKLAQATAADGPHIPTALDIYMTCAPDEAARRILLSQGVAAPTAEQLDEQTEAVAHRREQDRNRNQSPFAAPTTSIAFAPGDDPQALVQRSWQLNADHELPITISLDNTQISKPDMLQEVAELSLAAMQYEA